MGRAPRSERMGHPLEQPKENTIGGEGTAWLARRWRSIGRKAIFWSRSSSIRLTGHSAPGGSGFRGGVCEVWWVFWVHLPYFAGAFLASSSSAALQLCSSFVVFAQLSSKTICFSTQLSLYCKSSWSPISRAQAVVNLATFFFRWLILFPTTSHSALHLLQGSRVTPCWRSYDHYSPMCCDEQ